MITLFNPIKFLLVSGLFITASIMMSCDDTDTKKTTSIKVPLHSSLNEPQQITLISRNDGLVPPKVYKIADAKPAKKIKVGKPFVTKNPNENNLGFPFFEQYKKEDGLAFNTVHKLVEDNEGYLWIGTFEGLSRFDGHQFVNFSSLNGANSNSFSSSLVKDQYGRLWMYNSDGWLELFDGEKFVGFKFLGGERLNWVLDILSDKSGNLWFATDNGLLKLEGIENIEEIKVTRYLENDGLIDNFINCLEEDALGNIWIGTVNGISKFDGQTFINYSKDNGLFSNQINDVHSDNRGDVWIATAEGLDLYNNNQFSHYSTSEGLSSNHINIITHDRNGNIWIGTKNGIHKLKREKNEGINIQQIRNIEVTDLNVLDILEDKNGTLWIGADKAGLLRYNPGGPTYFPYDRVWQLKDASNIWFAAKGKGITKFTGSEFLTYTNQQGLGSNEVSDIIQDHQNNIWISSESTLTKFDGSYFTYYTSEQGLPLLETYVLEVDTKNNIWTGSWNNGVIRFDGEQFTHFTRQQGLSINTGFLLTADNKGNVWFGGTYLDKFDGQYFTNYQFPMEAMVPNFMDNEGNLWLSSYKYGVIKLKGEAFNLYTTKDGLPYNSVSNAVEDTVNNQIWFSTYKGIASLKKDRLNSQEGNPPFKKYTASQIPLETVEVVDTKGVLWGEGEGKIIRFDPQNQQEEPTDFTIKINNISINNEKLSWYLLKENLNLMDSLAAINEMALHFGKTLSEEEQSEMKSNYQAVQFDGVDHIPYNLVLPYSKNKIDFEFIAIDLTNGKDFEFQYYLEGYDRDWTPLSKDRKATFGNIKEGDYTFHLKAIHPLGISKKTSYTFKVLPPWYRTWWAYGLYTFSLIGLLWLFRYQELKKQQHKLQAKQEKLAEQQRINEVTSKFVPIAFLNSLGRNNIMEVQLGDAIELDVTVLFLDIRDYTTLAEGMTPEGNFRFVIDFNKIMGPIIQQNGGFVNQYMGDSIMALFKNAPLDALRAAIQMQQILSQNNIQRIAHNLSPIRIGIGFHTGSLMMGIIGDDKRMDAATISDTVNTASRIESLTKYYHVNILLSDESLNQIKQSQHEDAADKFNVRYLGKVQLKGKKEPVGIYECFDGDAPDSILKKQETQQWFKEGMDCYLSNQFELAGSNFEKVITINKADFTAQFFYQKSNQFLLEGVPENWTGIEVMTFK